MGNLNTLTKLSGTALLTLGLVGGGTLTASAAFADDGPIAPADAPEVMELPWPEYPADGDTHTNILVATTYLNNLLDANSEPHWDEPPTNTYSPALEEVLFEYQEFQGLEENGELKEELWQHFSDLQFDLSTVGVPWGPGESRNYYDQGDSGAGVEAVQSLLIHHGYLDADGLDGQYGPGTQSAVEDFQTDVVCDEASISVSAADCVDGWTGEVTWRALIASESGQTQ
jgi:hypothetical protein